MRQLKLPQLPAYDVGEWETVDYELRVFKGHSYSANALIEYARKAVENHIKQQESTSK